MFCELLAEVNKRLNEPFYFDGLFVYFMMLSRAINEELGELKEDE